MSQWESSWSLCSICVCEAGIDVAIRSDIAPLSLTRESPYTARGTDVDGSSASLFSVVRPRGVQNIVLLDTLRRIVSPDILRLTIATIIQLALALEDRPALAPFGRPRLGCACEAAEFNKLA